MSLRLSPICRKVSERGGIGRVAEEAKVRILDRLTYVNEALRERHFRIS